MVACLGGEIFEEAVLADAVLQAELLPELHPDLVAALPHLYGDDLARHLSTKAREREKSEEKVGRGTEMDGLLGYLDRQAREEH